MRAYPELWGGSPCGFALIRTEMASSAATLRDASPKDQLPIRNVQIASVIHRVVALFGERGRRWSLPLTDELAGRE